MSRACRIVRRNRIRLDLRRRRAYERWWARQREQHVEPELERRELELADRRRRRTQLVAGALAAAAAAAGVVGSCKGW